MAFMIAEVRTSLNIFLVFFHQKTRSTPIITTNQYQSDTSTELDYEEADGDPTGEAAQMAQQTLTYYELDLGLNHVVRKYSEPLEDHANMLISVPGGNEGPSGVLICSENYITYKNFGDQPDIRCPIPR